jgi:hypothetical protein
MAMAVPLLALEQRHRVSNSQEINSLQPEFGRRLVSSTRRRLMQPRDRWQGDRRRGRARALAGSPDRTEMCSPQWQVYRRRHLLIGTSRSDARSYALGKQIVLVLAEHLQESNPRVTRGPDRGGLRAC